MQVSGSSCAVRAAVLTFKMSDDRSNKRYSQRLCMEVLSKWINCQSHCAENTLQLFAVCFELKLHCFMLTVSH